MSSFNVKNVLKFFKKKSKMFCWISPKYFNWPAHISLRHPSAYTRVYLTMFFILRSISTLSNDDFSSSLIMMLCHCVCRCHLNSTMKNNTRKSSSNCPVGEIFFIQKKTCELFIFGFSARFCVGEFHFEKKVYFIVENKKVTSVRSLLSCWVLFCCLFFHFNSRHS